MENGTKESRVRSVARALAILKCFIKPPHQYGITELSGMLKLSKGTVHLLVKTLEDEGFLEQVEETRKYRVGPTAYELGAAALGELRIPSRIHLQHLSYELSMPCYLAINIGNKAVLIEKAEPVNPFMVVMQIGAVLPYHTTSMGKILLAYTSAENRDQLINHTDLPALTPNTITSRELLKKEIEEVEKQGYALDREETLPGVFCLAVPVWDGTGRVIAALSLVAPSTALNKDNYWQYLPALKKYSSLITKDMTFMKN
ncbi:MAG: IclR family transcriptional regulator [Peptococcaceae bacterium]|nr:IclR family transcriptional regulator [Peptococcaceae bacterium]